MGGFLAFIHTPRRYGGCLEYTMNIIIVGCGKVGTTLAKRLNEEKHDIVLIDKDGDKLRSITDRYDVMGLEGNGASVQTQKEAGVASADLLIATTNSDELNLLCCLIAKKAGDCHTIARIRDPEYYKEVRYIKEELNLSMVINPEQAAAAEIARLIKFPSAVSIDSFARGRLELMKISVPDDSALNGMKVFEMSQKLHCSVLLCVIERGNEVIIPYGNMELKAQDNISFIAEHNQAREFLAAVGLSMTTIKSLMLIGGSKISYYIAKRLEDTNISVKIIDWDFDRCQTLSDLLEKAIIINGDGSDQQLLAEEGIADMDAIGSMTGIDEENIVLSLYAASVSKAKIITKINRVDFQDVIRNMNLGSVINPKNITADLIVRYVRAMNNTVGSNVETLYKIAGDRAEALEFKVGKESSVIGKQLQDMKFIDQLLIAAITRNGKVIRPNGQSMIEAGDTVIVVTTENGLNDLEDILA